MWKMLLPEDLNLLHSSKRVLDSRWSCPEPSQEGRGLGRHTRTILGDVWAFWVVNGRLRHPWMTFWEATKGFKC